MTLAPQPHTDTYAHIVALEHAYMQQHRSYVAWLQAQGQPAAELEIGGGVAAFTGVASPLSQAVGMGLAPLADPLGWAHALKAFFATHHMPAAVELALATPPALAAALVAAGFVPEEYSSVLVFDLQAVSLPPLVVPQGYALAAAHSLDETVLAAALEGFGLPLSPANMAFQHHWYASPGNAQWVARHEGQPVAVANAYTVADTLLLAGASTLPAHRRRGLQQGLILARLQQAQAAGLRWATVATDPASVSEANMLRLGFSRLYARVKWVEAL